MCCDNKFLFFIRVRTGSLIFAWIGAVLSGLGTLGCFITNMVFTLLLFNGLNFQYGIYVYVLTSSLLVYFSTGFIASVFLLIGIIQRKPKLIKGYIIYGMILSVLFVIFIITLECIAYVHMVARVFEILGFFVYGSILYLHYLTFKDSLNSNTNDGNIISTVQA